MSRFYRIATWVALVAMLIGSAYSLQTAQEILYSLKKLIPYPPNETDISKIKLGSKFGDAKDQRNCPVSAYDVPGQAWAVGLSSGGITLNANTKYANQTVDPTFGNLKLSISREESGRTNIVVIDHFTPFRLMLDEDGPNSGKPPIDTLRLRHGDLVISHMVALLKVHGYTPTYTSNPINPVILNGYNKEIKVFRIEIGEFRKDSGDNGTTKKLTNDLNELSGNFANSNTIINMSFSIIPCEIFANYREIRDYWSRQTPPQRYTLREYLKVLNTKNNFTLNEKPFDPTRSIMRDIPDSDDFRNWILNTLTDLRKKSDIVMVASSGNFGLPYSTAPAFWDQVISVGAVASYSDSDEDTGYKKVGIYDNIAMHQEENWSDVADVYSVGEWFRLPIDQIEALCTNGKICITEGGKNIPTLIQQYSSQPSNQSFGYRGTSFAAPSVTAYLATLKSDNSCFTSTGTGFSPVIKQHPVYPPVSANPPPFILFQDRLIPANCR